MGDPFERYFPWSDSAIAVKLKVSVASDHIRNLEVTAKQGRDASMQLQALSHELESIRRENESLRSENTHFYQEIQHYRERPSTATTMHPQPSIYPQPSSSVMGDPSRSLPPLTNGIPAANSMQGVQYSDERR